MAGVVVGRVASIHRYPVKSMGGETLAAATVTGRGLAGDRAYALVDGETGRVASAKHPRRWPDLLLYRARFLVDPEPDGPPPPVAITDPTGATRNSSAPDLDRRLSERFGRPVRLTSEPPAASVFEYQWPDQPGLRYQGRLYRNEVTEHVMPPGTFFDSGIIHLVTRSSLAELRRIVPASGFEPDRFRANLVIDTGTPGFLENGWVGREVRIGHLVRIRIVKRCIRCVMVNLPQPGIGADSGVLAAAFAHNEGHVGAKGDITAGGQIRVGDPVTVG